MKIDKDKLADAVIRAVKQCGRAEVKIERGEIVVIETRRKILITLPIEKERK